MSRFAAQFRVIVWEEPIYVAGDATARLTRRICPTTQVEIVTPEIGRDSDEDEITSLRNLLNDLLEGHHGPLVRWYYTPMMLPFSQHVTAACTVYDCMDELANFKNAPPELVRLEAALLEEADLVFTGGYSLYEAKRDRHPSVHAFPSGVEIDHFAKARLPGSTPDDQSGLPTPRLGFYGVIDERLDLALLGQIATARPDWSFVIVGPVVKISETDLPRRPNLHYLGAKSYAELPDYLRGWDVALMPFAINEATRFISPTKTPEYLAAGCPVVSTPIKDVVRHYKTLEAVKIADSPETFVAACDEALDLAGRSGWLAPVDEALAQSSWDQTYGRMADLIASTITRADNVQPIVSPTIWPAERRKPYDVMVVGAGFAGAVMAERLANDAGK
ncbi:MAG: glycosyltransferase, partial [Zymomonas sp.]